MNASTLARLKKQALVFVCVIVVSAGLLIYPMLGKSAYAIDTVPPNTVTSQIDQ